VAGSVQVATAMRATAVSCSWSTDIEEAL